ncbi:MAG: LiaF domain-containing protein [Leptospirales bacterium]
MNFLFTGTFWGIVIILVGVSVILKAYFNINIPVFRTLLGLFIVILGLSIVWGRPLACGDSRHVFFGEGSFHAQKGEDRFNVIFGKGKSDLSKIVLEGKNKTIEVNTVFGENVVYYNAKQPVRFTVNVAFGEATLPEQKGNAFGKTEFKTPTYDESKPHLIVNINVAFGSVKVKIKKAE